MIMVYDRNLSDKARNLIGKAERKNLMGRFDEARELAQKAINALESEDCKDYYKTLAWAYFFIKNNRKCIEYLEKEICASKQWRKEYYQTDEAYMYGSRFLDASISADEKELMELKSGWLTQRTAHHPRLEETATLVAFDLDGTLLQMKGYSWGYISKMLGVDEKKEEGFEAEYRIGNTDYAKWVSQVLELYKQGGLNRRHLEDWVSKISLVPGARETIDELKKRGKKIALISGSLDFLANAFFPDGTFDHTHINRVYFNSTGTLSDWIATPYGSDLAKRQGLLEICKPKKIVRYERNKNWEKIHEEWKDRLDLMYSMWGPDDDGLTKVVTDYPGYQLHRIVYVGDNDNDVEVAKSAGMAIAVNSESKKLKGVCEVSVNGDLRGILEFIG